MKSSKPMANKNLANAYSKFAIQHDRTDSINELSGSVQDLADLLAQIVVDQYRKEEVTAATQQCKE